MPNRKFVAGSNGYRYSINGQEKEIDLNENITSAEFWTYDSRIGRRWNTDPKPNERMSVYSVFGNSPIWLSDPRGDTIIIKGDQDFQNRTQAFLQKIAQTEAGKIVVERLQKSTQNYTIKEVWLRNNSQYDSEKNELRYDDNPWIKRLEGGYANGLLILAHELFHAYDDDTYMRYQISDKIAERRASYFQNYISSVYSLGDMRTHYGSDYFDYDESVFNPQMEKITDYKVQANVDFGRPRETVLGRDRSSDNTTVRLKIAPVTDPALTITFTRTFTISGKVTTTSVKKENQHKIAREKD